MSLDRRFARNANDNPTPDSPPLEAVGVFFERDIGPDPVFEDEIWPRLIGYANLHVTGPISCGKIGMWRVW
jgi:hypothetical protein